MKKDINIAQFKNDETISTLNCRTVCENDNVCSNILNNKLNENDHYSNASLKRQSCNQINSF